MNCTFYDKPMFLSLLDRKRPSHEITMEVTKSSFRPKSTFYVTKKAKISKSWISKQPLEDPFKNDKKTPRLKDLKSLID